MKISYNSVVFATTSVNDIAALLVTPDFPRGDYSLANITEPLSTSMSGSPLDENVDHNVIRKLQASALNLRNMTVKECLDTYQQPLISNYGNFLMVTSETPEMNNTLLRADYGHKPIPELLPWLCNGSDLANTASSWVPSWDDAICNITPQNNTWLLFTDAGDVSVDYCLADATAARCEVSVSTCLLIVVVICNVLKLLVLFYLVTSKAKPLVTIGDAIESFLLRPDSTTKNLTLLSYPEVRWGFWKIPDSPDSQSGRSFGKEFHPQSNKKWADAVSNSRRYTTFMR